MYINSRTGAVQEWVAVHKWHPHLQLVCAPRGHSGTPIAAHCVPCPQWNTDRCMRPLCEVPIHVITDWPISDYMNSSKQDFSS
ncbi:unnamed protein product [Staurois parvus]|uniref:Uncharacterized protein n=1 Tax=Staurois parvus TaxID=386267 RepID=A0ABN9D693_9NEOB|nr:unnamed protein product [Staurois parvus]